ncbi:MAG: DUF892 family protein [Capsulimonadaceae bacterium]
MLEDVKSRIIRYLTDAYAVEEGELAALRDLTSETADLEVKQVVSEHIAVTESQMARLRERMETLGGNVNQAKCVVNTTLEKGSLLMNLFHDAEDKATQDLIKVYAVEACEVGMYTALHAFTDAVNDYGTARLVDTIRDEEQLAAERILRLIPPAARRAVARTNLMPQDVRPA